MSEDKEAKYHFQITSCSKKKCPFNYEDYTCRGDLSGLGDRMFEDADKSRPFPWWCPMVENDGTWEKNGLRVSIIIMTDDQSSAHLTLYKRLLKLESRCRESMDQMERVVDKAEHFTPEFFRILEVLGEIDGVKGVDFVEILDVEGNGSTTQWCVSCNGCISPPKELSRGTPPVCDKCLDANKMETCPDCRHPIRHDAPCPCHHINRR